MADFNFDDFKPSNHAARPEQEILPAGTYEVMATRYVDKLQEKGFVCLQYIVISGPMKGREVPQFLYLNSQKDAGRQYARDKLADLCRNIGLADGLGSFDDLLQRPVMVTLKKDMYNGQERNEFVGFKRSNASAPVQGQPTSNDYVAADADDFNPDDDDLPF